MQITGGSIVHRGRECCVDVATTLDHFAPHCPQNPLLPLHMLLIGRAIRSLATLPTHAGAAFPTRSHWNFPHAAAPDPHPQPHPHPNPPGALPMGQTLDTLETLATTAALHLQHLLHLGGSPQPPPFAVRSLSNSAATRGPVLVAGLGNWTLDPRARHSVGMALLDFWADSEGLTWRRDRALAGLLAGVS